MISGNGIFGKMVFWENGILGKCVFGKRGFLSIGIWDFGKNEILGKWDDSILRK